MGVLTRRWYRLPGGQMIDEGDGRPFSTEFAFSRFLVPHLTMHAGFALFVDADFLFLADIAALFEMAQDDPSKAVWCVHHDYSPPDGAKMDGLAQQAYPFKNWSSLMLFNCGHEVNWSLTPREVNTRPGRWLHSFGWLDRDEHLGQLEHSWNWIPGHSQEGREPYAVHFTEGGPWHLDPRYREVPYASEWMRFASECCGWSANA
jgi:hypothetical protein